MASDIVAVAEKESSTQDSLVVPYQVTEKDQALKLTREQAVTAALAQGLIDQGVETFTYSLARISDRICRVTLQYKEATIPRLKLPPVGEETVDYRFNFQQESELVTKAIECIGCYNSDGVMMGPDPDNPEGPEVPLKKLHVNIQSYATYLKALGKQISPLPVCHTLDYTVPNSMVDATYKATVESLKGCFNDAPFMGFQVGELQLVQFNAAKRTDHDWQFTFGFGSKRTKEDEPFDAWVKNDDGIYVPATITVPVIRPCDVVWSEDAEHVVDDERWEMRSHFVVVQRVGVLADFLLLGLPGIT